MATFTSGDFSTTNQYIKYRIVVKENSVNETANKRNVTVSVFVYRTNTGYTTYGSGTCYCTIGGTSYSATISSSQKITHDGITLFSKTLDIAFNADGAKTLTVSAYISHDRFSSTSHSFSPTLTPIPRSSTISVSNGTLGTEQTIAITRASTSFTHTVKYSCGSASGTIGTAKTTATSLSWTPPLSLASQNTTGTTVNATITCTTYSGNTVIGSKSVSIKLAIPASIVPAVAMTVTDANGFYDTFGAYIVGKSRFNIALQTTAAYSSAIKKISITANGSTYSSAPVITGVILNSGSNRITATVTDGRGRVATVVQNITVAGYAAPAIMLLEPRRCDQDGTPNEQGRYIKISYEFRITSLEENKVTLILQYKKSSDTTWNSQTLFDNQEVYEHEGDVIFPADDGSSYAIKMRIKDLLTDFNDVETSASTGFSIMTIAASGKAVGFGKIPEIDEGVEFAGDVYVAGDTRSKAIYGDDIYITDNIHLSDGTINDYVKEVGQDANFKYRKSASGIIELWGDKQIAFPAGAEIGGVYRSIVELDLSAYLSKIISGNCLVQDTGRIPILCRKGGDSAVAELIIVSPITFPQKTLTVPIYVLGEI